MPPVTMPVDPAVPPHPAGPALPRRLLIAGAAVWLAGCAHRAAPDAGAAGSAGSAGSAEAAGPGPFDPGRLAAAQPTPFTDWQPRTFPGKRPTRYRVESEAGRVVLRADARASVSMLRRALRVEPADLGELRFSWRVPVPLTVADLRDRDAEDAPVRLVLAFDGDAARLPARDRLLFELARTLTGEPPPFATLMYVWDHRAEAGAVVPSNSTSRIRKLVVDGAGSPHGPWRHHARDVGADFRRVFDEAPGALVGVGVMTDTDNARSAARVWYGPVTLTAPDGRRLLT